MDRSFDPTDSEEAILHILMVMPEMYYHLSELKPYMFNSQVHEEIFTLMDNAIKKDTVLDFHILTELAKEKDNIIKEGGIEFLTKIRNKEGINPENIRNYERIIIDSWKYRGLSKLCVETTIELSKSASVQESIVRMRKKLDDLEKSTPSDTIASLGDSSEEVWEQIKNKAGNPGISGISTGLKGLDDYTAGLEGGELWYIAGRPGMGKTALILNMLLNSAKQGKKGILFSLEMNKQKLIERMLSIETGIPLYPNIRLGKLDGDELLTIQKTLNTFKLYPIFLDTNFISSLDYLEMIIRKYKQSSDIDIVFIDYVQLLAERDADATQALGRISRRCKLLGENLDIPIIIASQLNRSLEARTDKRPIMPDLRQSGNLEEDADLIIGLYRDKRYNLKTSEPDLMEVIIIKQRNGPVGTVYASFKEETNIITDKKGIAYDGKQTETEREQVGEAIRTIAEPRVKELGF